jgi:hypothetical protein
MRRLVVVVAVGIAGVVGVAVRAQGASTKHLRAIAIRDNAFWNYDFAKRAVSATSVDWPVDLVFRNNADIDKVKAGLNGHMPFHGSTMYARLKDRGGAATWGWDGGKKTLLCPVFGQTAYHTRLYADGDGRLYNTSWGYYVLGTAHQDHNECSRIGRWSGRSELAEKFVGGISREAWGNGAPAFDRIQMGNQEPYRREGNHIWQNNGLATAINVP